MRFRTTLALLAIGVWGVAVCVLAGAAAPVAEPSLRQALRQDGGPTPVPSRPASAATGIPTPATSDQSVPPFAQRNATPTPAPTPAPGSVASLTTLDGLLSFIRQQVVSILSTLLLSAIFLSPNILRAIRAWIL